jgi:hypothetical protein
MLSFARSSVIDGSEGRAPTVTDGDSLIRLLEDLKVAEVRSAGGDAGAVQNDAGFRRLMLQAVVGIIAAAASKGRPR